MADNPTPVDYGDWLERFMCWWMELTFGRHSPVGGLVLALLIGVPLFPAIPVCVAHDFWIAQRSWRAHGR